MKPISRRRKHIPTFLICTTLALVVVFSFSTLSKGNAHAQVSSVVVQQVSSDPFTNSTSQHRTQVEPGTFSFGSTVVSAFQSGRFDLGGGASGISWVTSFDSGRTWKGGTLPHMTVFTGGTNARVSDSAVAYDVAHHTWIISALTATTTFDGVTGSTAIVVSRSSDGLTWSDPVVVAASGSTNNFDKDWIVCDNHAMSPFFGRCYEEWDDSNQNGLILMSYSNDGGLTWFPAQSPASQSFSALGGQPVVQPNGTVIVPIYGFDLVTGEQGLYSYRSIDGGASWTDLLKISPSIFSSVSNFYRGGSLPSAAIDKAGKVYLVWAGCYFESNCATDDIVLTTTTDGLSWTPLQRIPLDAIGSGVEHITAGLAVDAETAGKSSHLAVAYYYWPAAGCSPSTCQIFVGVASSTNGGSTWSHPQTVAGPTLATSWANTDQGFMTGDYIAAAISDNRAVTVVPTATVPNNQTLNQYMVGVSLPVIGGSTPCETLSSFASTPKAPQQDGPVKDSHTAH